MIDITFILEIVVTLLFLILSKYAIPYLKTLQVQRLIKIAVAAFEEEYGAGTGEVKYQKVKEFIESKGYTYDEETMKVLIDGAVWELINQYKSE